MPNANTIEVVKRIRAEMTAIQKDLPRGLKAGIAYDASEYLSNAIHEVVGTLTDTLLIVVVVIFLFLVSLRSVLVPVVAISVSDLPISAACGEPATRMNGRWGICRLIVMLCVAGGVGFSVAVVEGRDLMVPKEQATTEFEPTETPSMDVQEKGVPQSLFTWIKMARGYEVEGHVWKKGMVYPGSPLEAHRSRNHAVLSGYSGHLHRL